MPGISESFSLRAAHAPRQRAPVLSTYLLQTSVGSCVSVWYKAILSRPGQCSTLNPIRELSQSCPPRRQGCPGRGVTFLVLKGASRGRRSLTLGQQIPESLPHAAFFLISVCNIPTKTDN